ncbi:MAG: hypothetical protein LBC40_09980 [Dysgonamonadaceae bacterium]|jgi:hypothetical protein|nr:hypothetical protein [Dysgonamonadaceae bacterium]
MPNETDKTKLEAAEQKLREALEELSAAMGTPAALFPDHTMQAIIDLINQAKVIFSPYDHPLTPVDRKRLIGTGYKNFGFIEQAYASAIANPTLVPGYLDVITFKNDVYTFDRLRNLEEILKQFELQISDAMYVASDRAYHDATEYYNAVKEAARHRVLGAEAAYNALKDFFKRSKHPLKDSEQTDD